MADVEHVHPRDIITPRQVADIIKLQMQYNLPDHTVKDMIYVMTRCTSDVTVKSVWDLGLWAPMSDSELDAYVLWALSDQADAVAKVVSGNEKPLGAILGAVAKNSKGKADPNRARIMVMEYIEEMRKDSEQSTT